MLSVLSSNSQAALRIKPYCVSAGIVSTLQTRYVAEQKDYAEKTKNERLEVAKKRAIAMDLIQKATTHRQYLQTADNTAYQRAIRDFKTRNANPNLIESYLASTLKDPKAQIIRVGAPEIMNKPIDWGSPLFRPLWDSYNARKSYYYQYSTWKYNHSCFRRDGSTIEPCVSYVIQQQAEAEDRLDYETKIYASLRSGLGGFYFRFQKDNVSVDMFWEDLKIPSLEAVVPPVQEFMSEQDFIAKNIDKDCLE